MKTLPLFSLLFTLIVGVALGWFLAREQSYDRGYADAWGTARARALDAGLIPATPESITALTGRIEKIEESALIIRVDSVLTNPFAEPLPEKRIVHFTDATEIVQHIVKDAEQFAHEEETFVTAQTVFDPTQELPLPPHPYTSTTGNAADFTEGARVTVETNEDITTDKEFFAQKITITL